MMNIEEQGQIKVSNSLFSVKHLLCPKMDKIASIFCCLQDKIAFVAGRDEVGRRASIFLPAFTNLELVRFSNDALVMHYSLFKK